MAEVTPTASQNAPRPTSKGGSNSPPVPGLRLGKASVNSKGVNDATTSYSEDTTLVYSAPVEADSSAANELIMNTSEALKPDPGTELDFEVRDDKFGFSPRQMSQLVNSRSLSAFHAVGGLDGLEKGLRTDRRCGLSSEEMLLDRHVSVNATVRSTSASAGRSPNGPFADRKRVFGDNKVPTKKPPNFLQLMWMTYNDYVLFLLTAAATISLGIGLYQSFGTARTPNNPPVEWIEGVAILVAIIIIVLVGSVNDYQKQQQFAKVNKKKQDRYVNVIRSGKPQEISIFDILVGDVVHLQSGDVIPADGILIDGYNVRCDESTMTGESDLLRKHPGDEVFRTINAHRDFCKLDPFVVSGAKVAEGIGTFFVTATGVNSSYGKILMSIRKEPESTPLQSKLNTLAKHIAKLGGTAALLLFVVLFIKFLIRLPHNTQTPTQKGQTFLNILIIALTVLVIAIPEGLPLAVTLALAFATTKMLKENNLVRQLQACEIMGNATSICSDKTGTLTQNRMTVIAGTVGATLQFGNEAGVSPIMLKPDAPPAGAEGVSISECVRHLADDVKAILRQSIAINSTAFEGSEDGWLSFIGSKTETALLAFARDYLGMQPVSIERSNAKIVQLIPFDAARQCMATVVEIKDGKYRLYVKGAPEILLAKCTKILQNPADDASDTRITVDNTEILNQVIASYASRSLRTIGLVFRDFEQWPPAGVRSAMDDENEVELEDILQDMVFLGVMGIQDPLRDGAGKAVRTCQKAGVVVRMVTGDNILTAKAIAEQCGILSAGDIAMEGLQFRKLSKHQMSETVPRLRVLARSSPEDKRILVTLLKEMGETVAVTGDGTNDAPALAAADVGFSMGISGTEVAREASSIVLLDDDFSSIVTAIMWGRAVNDAVQKFLQFQITITLTSAILTFVSAAASSEEQPVLTPVQLMWVNLFQDTLAALALATDPPTPSVLDRKPDPKSAPLITIAMWKMIVGQSIYQLAVTLTLYFGGMQILSYHTAHEKEQLQTSVFNVYVWMQIFNMYNFRQLGKKFNIFEGILRNRLFIAVSLIMIGGQILIAFIGGKTFSVTRLSKAQWAYSVVLGALSILIGVIIRVIPDKLFEKMYLGVRRVTSRLTVVEGIKVYQRAGRSIGKSWPRERGEA